MAGAQVVTARHGFAAAVTDAAPPTTADILDRSQPAEHLTGDVYQPHSRAPLMAGPPRAPSSLQASRSLRRNQHFEPGASWLNGSASAAVSLWSASTLKPRYSAARRESIQPSGASANCASAGPSWAMTAAATPSLSRPTSPRQTWRGGLVPEVSNASTCAAARVLIQLPSIVLPFAVGSGRLLHFPGLRKTLSRQPLHVAS